MNRGAAIKRRREGMANAVVERWRRDPQLIGVLVARPAFLHAFQSSVKQLQAVFPSLYGRSSFVANALGAMRSRVSSEDRLLLVSGGRLCAMLARRLLCSNGECAFRNPLRLGTSVLCRRLLVLPSPFCVATLKGHGRQVNSMAFHPTAPLLASGSYDKTVKLWR